MLSLQRNYDNLHLFTLFFSSFFCRELRREHALKRPASGVHLSKAIGPSRESNPSRKIRRPRSVTLGQVAAKDFACMLHAAFST